MNARRSLLAVNAVAALVAFSGLARAQQYYCKGNDGGGEPLPGTVPYGLLDNALKTNAQIYSAANMAERRVLPVLARMKGGTLVGYEMGSTFSVLRVPMCDTDEGDSGRVEMGKVDLSGGGFFLGYRAGPVGFYLVGSGAGHFVGAKLNERAFLPFLGIGLAQFSPAAFVRRDFSREDRSLSVILDAMVGVQLATKQVGSLNLAYVASKGVYTNITAAKVHAFVGAVVRPQKDQLEDQARQEAGALLDQIPYARFGFLTLDWLVGQARETIGTTSLYARRLRYPSMPRPSASEEDARRQALAAAVPFTTTHFEQYAIGKLIDLSVAGGWQPELFLHEATIGVRIGNPMPPDIAMAQQEDSPASASEEERFGWRILAGVVRMPERWYYGTPGGYRIRAGIEATASSKNIFGTMRAGINSPETIAIYPYAYNAGDFYISVGYRAD